METLTASTVVLPKKRGRRSVDRWPTLTRLMKEQSIDEALLADRANVSVFAVKTWRRGSKSPNLARLRLIAAALGTDAETLVKDAPNPKKFAPQIL